MVGWSSYHDQWLSEGFADFSAGLFLQLTNKESEPVSAVLGPCAQGHRRKRTPTASGANDAGPIWMGIRLSSEKNAGAYSRVVYNKGGYVLHMLRQMMYDDKDGDRPFIAMMQDFVQQHHESERVHREFPARCGEAHAAGT